LRKPAKNQPIAAKGFAAPLPPLQSGKKRPRAQAGIQSLENGLLLFRALVQTAAPMKLRDIAAASRMSASKAHRYMVSLCRSGLVAQDAHAGEYRLGPYAVEMSVACLNSLRPIKLASQALEAIGREIDLTVAIAAWGNHGPAIVRIEESLRAVSMNVRAGTVVPLTRSAAGLVFAAFMPRHVVEPLLAAEVRRAAERAEVEAQLETVRSTGVGVVSQKLVPGADALAVPVFDHRGAIALSLLAVGTSGTFSLATDGAVAQALKRHANVISRELGFRN
jgi:DNA-binding IclR family transcriptional regulator